MLTHPPVLSHTLQCSHTLPHRALPSPQNGELRNAPEPITDLQEAFRLLDPDGRGHIESGHLQQICTKLGENLTEEEVCGPPPCASNRPEFLCAPLVRARARPTAPSEPAALP